MSTVTVPSAVPKEHTYPRAPAASPAPVRDLDEESREWLRTLRSDGLVKDQALARLHGLLLRAARFEVGRRRAGLPHLRGDELDDIALEAADDALMSVLQRLDDFRGASRFTTWVYKFALLEAAVKLRRRAWQGREVPLEPDTLERCSECRSRARRPGRAGRAPGRAGGRDRRGPDTAPAARARRPGVERRAHRRARRAAAHHTRCALQDACTTPGASCGYTCTTAVSPRNHGEETHR